MTATDGAATEAEGIGDGGQGLYEAARKLAVTTLALRRLGFGDSPRRKGIDAGRASLPAEPEAAAREAGICLGTAHDVRERLRNGEGPRAPSSQAPGGGSRQPSAPRLVAAPPGVSADAAWSGTRAKLSKEPGLPYTAAGRALLHWVKRHLVKPGRWAAIASLSPSRCPPAARSGASSCMRSSSVADDAAEVLGWRGPRDVWRWADV